jgi:hypothetical protein
VRDQPESLPLTSAPQAHSDESDAVAGSVAPPTSPQPRHSVEKKDEETSEFKEPPRRSGRVRRAALPNTVTPSASARTHKANYAEKRGARDEVLAKPFYTTGYHRPTCSCTRVYRTEDVWGCKGTARQS